MSKDNDIDLYQFAKLFDAALASDNESVKKALRNFMLVASIVEAETDKNSNGPLTDVFDKIHHLERAVEDLKLMVQSLHQSQKIGGTNYVGWYGNTQWGDPNIYKSATTATETTDILDLYKKFGSTKGKI